MIEVITTHVMLMVIDNVVRCRLHPRIELVVVMIIIPMIVNSIQFWITDSYLQHRSSPSWLPSTPMPSSLLRLKRSHFYNHAHIHGNSNSRDVGYGSLDINGGYAGNTDSNTSNDSGSGNIGNDYVTSMNQMRRSSRAVGPSRGHQSNINNNDNVNNINRNSGGQLQQGHGRDSDNGDYNNAASNKNIGSSNIENDINDANIPHMNGNGNGNGNDEISSLIATAMNEEVDRGSLSDDRSLVFSRDSDLTLLSNNTKTKSNTHNINMNTTAINSTTNKYTPTSS
jgi:hypothetical protein